MEIDDGVRLRVAIEGGRRVTWRPGAASDITRSPHGSGHSWSSQTCSLCESRCKRTELISSSQTIINAVNAYVRPTPCSSISVPQ